MVIVDQRRPFEAHVADRTSKTVRVLDAKTFRNDPTMYGQLLDIVRPSYVDPTAVLGRDFEHCNILYLSQNGQRIEAFFMVGWEVLCVRAERRTSVYLGLSAVREELKNNGIARELYSRFARDAAEWELANGERLLLWYTTASPSACLAAYTIFEDSEPKLNGSYSATGAEMAHAIRGRYYSESPVSMHPFVLRGVATNTRYSESERTRIRHVCEKHKFALLEDLGIDETKGDRLLYVCHCPPLPKL